MKRVRDFTNSIEVTEAEKSLLFRLTETQKADFQKLLETHMRSLFLDLSLDFPSRVSLFKKRKETIVEEFLKTLKDRKCISPFLSEKIQEARILVWEVCSKLAKGSWEVVLDENTVAEINFLEVTQGVYIAEIDFYENELCDLPSDMIFSGSLNSVKAQVEDFIEYLDRDLAEKWGEEGKITIEKPEGWQ